MVAKAIPLVNSQRQINSQMTIWGILKEWPSLKNRNDSLQKEVKTLIWHICDR